MRDFWKGVGILFIIVGIGVGLSYGMGWFKVGYTETVGKAQQDAETKVFENSNAFTKAKKQEALKAYKEYMLTDDETAKKAILYTVGMSLADFDEDKYITDVKLRSWIKKAKY